MQRSWSCFAAVALGLASGCSGDRNLTLDEEQNGAFPDEPTNAPLDTPWGCLSSEPSSVPSVDSTAPPITYYLNIVSALNPLERPAGLEIQACALSDLYCARPIELQVTTDDLSRPGLSELVLPLGFLGYLQLLAPGYVPTEYHFLGPVLGTSGPEYASIETIELQERQTLLAQLELLGVPLTPDSGLVTVRTLDCLGFPSEGARVEMVNVAAYGWVMMNGLMVPNIDGALSTDATGIAGFVNVPAPFATIVEGIAPAGCNEPATADDACLDEVRYGRMAVVTKPGWVTLAALRPDYSYGR